MEKAIIWAIDPFDKETMPDRHLVKKMFEWAKAQGEKILPVMVLSPPPHELVAPYVQASKKASEHFLRELDATEFLEPQILIDDSMTRQGTVSELLKFSKQIHAPWVVVSSHGRSGVDRMIFGSFSENVLTHATTPVLFLTHFKHELTHPNPLNRVLFATDFTDSSYSAYKNFLNHAKHFKFEIVIFYVFTFPVLPSSGMGAEPVVPKNYFDEQKKWAEHEGHQWVIQAEHHGVNAKFILKHGGAGPNIGDTIIEGAEKNSAGMIAMTTHSGPIRNFVVGSVARDVFRANRFPVWVYGPKALDHNH